MLRYSCTNWGHTVSYSSDNPEPSSVSTGHLCQFKKCPVFTAALPQLVICTESLNVDCLDWSHCHETGSGQMCLTLYHYRKHTGQLVSIKVNGCGKSNLLIQEIFSYFPVHILVLHVNIKLKNQWTPINALVWHVFPPFISHSDSSIWSSHAKT